MVCQGGGKPTPVPYDEVAGPAVYCTGVGLPPPWQTILRPVSFANDASVKAGSAFFLKWQTILRPVSFANGGYSWGGVDVVRGA